MPGSLTLNDTWTTNSRASQGAPSHLYQLYPIGNKLLPWPLVQMLPGGSWKRLRWREKHKSRLSDISLNLEQAESCHTVQWRTARWWQLPSPFQGVQCTQQKEVSLLHIMAGRAQSTAGGSSLSCKNHKCCGKCCALIAVFFKPIFTFPCACLLSFDHKAVQLKAPEKQIARQQMLQRTASPPRAPTWQETSQRSKLPLTKYSRQNQLSVTKAVRWSKKWL